jgi:hypothetical protein
MGTIILAVQNRATEASDIGTDDLELAAFQADMLAFSTEMMCRWGNDGIEKNAVFIACNGQAAFSAPFDLDRDVEEIEKLIALREMALPKIAWQVRRDPEKWLCVALSGLLREHGRRGTAYVPRVEHGSNLRLVADTLAGTTAENRTTLWAEARRLRASGHTPVMVFLVSNPAFRLRWFSFRPRPHFEAVVPLKDEVSPA